MLSIGSFTGALTCSCIYWIVRLIYVLEVCFCKKNTDALLCNTSVYNIWIFTVYILSVNYYYIVFIALYVVMCVYSILIMLL